jgi:predicted ATPase
VEVGLELLLKRWLVRQHLPNWETGRRRRDLTLWTEGMRRGRFEFAHRHIRSALAGAIEPRRRQALHAQVAAALEARPAAEGDGLSEALAHHWAAAGDWSKALSHLERALRKAGALQADATTIHYYQQALDLVARLCEGAGGAEQAAAAWAAARKTPLKGG